MNKWSFDHDQIEQIENFDFTWYFYVVWFMLSFENESLTSEQKINHLLTSYNT